MPPRPRRKPGGEGALRPSRLCRVPGDIPAGQPPKGGCSGRKAAVAATRRQLAGSQISCPVALFLMASKSRKASLSFAAKAAKKMFKIIFRKRNLAAKNTFVLISRAIRFFQESIDFLSSLAFQQLLFCRAELLGFFQYQRCSGS